MLSENNPLDDLENYSDKEKLLNVIRSKREQNNAASANTSSNVWGTVRTDEKYSRTNGSAGGATSYSIYGGDRSTEDGQGSYDQFSEQLRRFNPVPTGSSSSTDQHERPTTKRSTWQSVKDLGKQYKDILSSKNEESHTDAPKRSTARPKLDARKLTDTEVLRLRPKMVEYIMWQTEHMDQFIIATTVGHDPSIEIWGDITPDEAEIIVDYLLARGKTDVRTAQAVRYASTLIDRLKLGLIIAPRFYATAMMYIKRGFSIGYD
jgi:hypothetical protein